MTIATGNGKDTTETPVKRTAKKTIVGVVSSLLWAITLVGATHLWFSTSSSLAYIAAIFASIKIAGVIMRVAMPTVTRTIERQTGPRTETKNVSEEAVKETVFWYFAWTAVSLLVAVWLTATFVVLSASPALIVVAVLNVTSVAIRTGWVFFAKKKLTTN